MKIHYDLDSISELKHTAVTTGTFDGVHLGHKTIIDKLISVAKQIDGESVLLTFYPHPRMVLFPDDHQIRLLNTQSEKEQLLESCGIDHLVVINFTKEFSRLSSLEFVRNILANKLKAKKLVIGSDHHFGRNREGSFAHLLEFGSLYGFEVEEIPAKDIDEVAVSSSKIRKAIEAGDIDTANKYLGYAYSFTGKVIKGKQLGRTIGYPTANIAITDPYKLIPAIGVYAVKVMFAKQTYEGMLSIGKNPTVSNQNILSIEVNIFEFNADIYNKEITVFIYKKLRDEEKYSSLDELKAQLAVDKQNALKFLI
ncbi:MAG: bifunctional riboflavin kinase/FAD synthetase [Bacteroidota bacterium]